MLNTPNTSKATLIRANRSFLLKPSHQRQKRMKCLCGAIKTFRFLIGFSSSASSITTSGRGSVWCWIGFGFDGGRYFLVSGSLKSPCIDIYCNSVYAYFSSLVRTA
jgi:hypothetical protein